METMRHGVFIPPHHPVDEDPTQCIQRDLQLIEHLDALGYEEAWIGEHHSSGFEIIASPEIFIAAAAARTERIKLGTGVVSLPYHNPLMVANRIIQLDHQTMGRVMFGVGPGLLPSDAIMLGIHPSTQRERMMQSLEVILRLMKGETVTEKTDWFELHKARCHLLPYTKPHPEVAVASAVTPSGGRAAGRYGLGMLCVTSTQRDGYDALGINWSIANEISQEVRGVPMDPSVLRLVGPVHLAETREQARSNVRFGLEKWIDYFFRINPAAQLGGDITGRSQSEQDLDPVESMIESGWGVIGTPDDAIAQIERLQKKVGEFGAFVQLAHNWADFENTKKSYELWQRYVAPFFRGANRNRVDSLQWASDNATEFMGAAMKAATEMIQKHEAERAEKKAAS